MRSEEFKSKILPLKNRLFRFAKWIVMNDLQAQDFVQDVFEKLWRMREELYRYKNPEALAMRMIKNLCLNEQKKLRRFISDTPNDDFTEPLPSPYEKLVIDDKKALMAKIIGSLSQQQRIVVQLRDIEGYEIAEIASITELSENNIWVILSRARKNIRDAYIKFEQNEESRNGRTDY
jgi:RNA polymerase sigma factor (sigma-70 family)